MLGTSPVVWNGPTLGAGDHHRGHAPAEEREVVAAAEARRVVEVIAEPLGRRLDALVQREVLVGGREPAAAAVHVEIDERYHVVGPVRRRDGIRDECLGADEALLLAREDTKITEFFSISFFAASTRATSIVTAGPDALSFARRKDGPVGIGADAVEVAADDHELLRALGIAAGKHAHDVHRTNTLRPARAAPAMRTRVVVSNESGCGALRTRLGRCSDRRRRSSSVLRRSAIRFPDGAMSSSATVSLTLMTGSVSRSKNELYEKRITPRSVAVDEDHRLGAGRGSPRRSGRLASGPR